MAALGVKGRELELENAETLLIESDKKLKQWQNEIKWRQDPEKAPVRYDIDELKKIPIEKLMGRPDKISSQNVIFYKCPFHNENSASMAVFREKNNFKCFGCGQYGSVVDIVMQKQNLSFRQALNYLHDSYL